MDRNEWKKWLSDVRTLDAESLPVLQEQLEIYPYCESLWMLYLKNLYLEEDVRFRRELNRAAVYITDRRMAYFLLYGDDRKRVAGPVEEESADRTTALIDAFLGDTPQEEELTIPVEYPMDYSAYLLQDEADGKEENRQPLEGFGLIDEFIEQSERNATAVQSAADGPAASEPGKTDRPEEVTPPEPPADPSEDDSYFTETLAKIYIKQQKYAKALDIIKKLSLKYPKKNIYFADQIRFLEKVIINTKSK